MGALAATVAAELNLGQHLNWFLCIGIALIIGAGLGLFVDLIIRWRFFNAPRLIVMVVTIGLAQLFGGDVRARLSEPHDLLGRVPAFRPGETEDAPGFAAD